MKTIENILNLLERADQLIRMESTGTPEEFATTLGISRASIFRLLDDFKNMKAPVKYCNSKRSYYYEYPVKIQFFCQVLRLDEMKQIHGGKRHELNTCYSENYNYSENIFKNVFFSLTF